MRLLLLICLICLIGVGCCQPTFTSTGSVRGHGYGQVYQFNPYQGIYYNYGNMPYTMPNNIYWFVGPDYFYWGSWN